MASFEYVSYPTLGGHQILKHAISEIGDICTRRTAWGVQIAIHVWLNNGNDAYVGPFPSQANAQAFINDLFPISVIFKQFGDPHLT